jgi:lysophospholipase L1-like esterase
MTKAVFFGASNVEGVGASEPAKRWASITAHTLGWEEINLGIGGTTVTGRDDTGQVTDENSGLGRVTDVLDAHPDVVLISYGANDFGQSKPLGTPDRFVQGTFFWDYDTMLRGLLYTLVPGQVVLSTAQYRSDAEVPNAQGLTLADYNHAIQQISERHGVRVLDPYTDAEIDARNWPMLSADDIHLNDTGHERLAAFYIDALRPIGLPV